jgi:hypothetical protein
MSSGEITLKNIELRSIASVQGEILFTFPAGYISISPANSLYLLVPSELLDKLETLGIDIRAMKKDKSLLADVSLAISTDNEVKLIYAMRRIKK